jgi:hypothetical protein
MSVVLALLFTSFLAATNPPAAPVNFYSQVACLWERGQKDAVLAIAQQRLQENADDVAGLLLTLEYHLDNFDVENVAAVAARVIAVGQRITTPTFRKAFPELKKLCEDLPWVLRVFAQDAELFEEERTKRKRAWYLIFGAYIHALQDDGYFNQ